MTNGARTLRIAIAPGRVGFDAEQGGNNGDFHRLCYARLFRYPQAGLVASVPEVVPWLAESYTVTDGGARYVIQLRSDIRSPFGNPLTADDVVWGWKRAFALRDVGKWVALVGSVTGPECVAAIDARTVAFALRAPNPTFLQQLTRATPTIVDSVEARRHATAADPWASAWLARNPAGFGPYALESSSFWGAFVFVANPDAPNPPPDFTRVEARIVPGAARRIALLRAGDIDLLPDLAPADAMALADAPGVQLLRAPSGSHVALSMHCQTPPFDRVEVRRAIARAIPTERIITEVYHGAAQPWHSPIPSTTPHSAEEGFRDFYDPDESRRLLAEAGLGRGFATELFVDGANALHLAVARIIVSALAAIGVQVALEPLDSATFWQGGRYARVFPMLIWQDRHQVPDPLYALIHDYHPGKLGLINPGAYANPAVVDRIERIEQTADDAARGALIREAQAIILADCPNAMLAQPDFLGAIRSGISGFFWPPDGYLPIEALRRS